MVTSDDLVRCVTGLGAITLEWMEDDVRYRSDDSRVQSFGRAEVRARARVIAVRVNVRVVKECQSKTQCIPPHKYRQSAQDKTVVDTRAARRRGGEEVVAVRVV